MTEDEMRRDQEICAAATPGPWRPGTKVQRTLYAGDTIIGLLDAPGDTAFVAAAREGWPRALTALATAGPCARHGEYHGAEAEELRKGIEHILEHCGGGRGEIADSLQDLLDRVDARDSLACLERIADLQALLLKSDAARAQMKAALEQAREEIQSAYGEYGTYIDDVLLGPDAIKGWLSPEEAVQLRAWVAQTQANVDAMGDLVKSRQEVCAQLIDMQIERDAWKAKAEAAEADVHALRSRTECSGREIDLTDPNDACQSARAHAKRAERAEAAAAQMRDDLVEFIKLCDKWSDDPATDGGGSIFEIRNNAQVTLAQTDVGAGWVSPEQHNEALVELRGVMRDERIRRDEAIAAWQSVTGCDTPDEAGAEMAEARLDEHRAQEQIQAWQMATGLLRGGDPSAITPEDLSRETQSKSRLLFDMRDYLLHRMLREPSGTPLEPEAQELLHRIQSETDESEVLADPIEAASSTDAGRAHAELMQVLLGVADDAQGLLDEVDEYQREEEAEGNPYVLGGRWSWPREADLEQLALREKLAKLKKLRAPETEVTPWKP